MDDTSNSGGSDSSSEETTNDSSTSTNESSQTPAKDTSESTQSELSDKAAEDNASDNTSKDSSKVKSDDKVVESPVEEKPADVVTPAQEAAPIDKKVEEPTQAETPVTAPVEPVAPVVAPVVAPTPATPIPAPVEDTADMATQKIDDTVTKTVQIVDNSGKVAVAIATTLAEQTATFLTAADDDSDPVKKIKKQLTDFLVANAVDSKKSADFIPSARLVVAIATTITDNPTREVLDVFLGFFRLQQDGAANMVNFMQGTNELPFQSIRPAAILRAMFYTLATQSVTRIDTGQALQVLKRPEIITYYTRRRKVYTNT